MANQYIALPIPSASTLSGDVTGTTSASKVVAIQGNPVSATPPTSAQVLVENSGATGSAWVTISGDSTMTSAGVITNTKLNTASVPAAGSLTTGNVLQVSGASALTYAALNLAGGSNYVTGALPVANFAAGTSAQVLMNNATPAATWTTISGDVALSNAGATTVVSLTGSSSAINIASTGNILTWNNATTAPGLAQTIPSTDVAPNNMTIHSQDAELAASTNKTGSNLILKSGAGATTAGIGGAVVLLPGTGSSVNGNISLFQASGSFGSGGGVVFFANAGTVPSSNPSAGNLLYSTGGALTSRGSIGAINTLCTAGSTGTINSQAQVSDFQFGTCETVSSATATTIWAYTTTANKGGIMTLFVSSRATTNGTGVVVGNTGCATYTLTWQNISGTVTLSTAGITLVGTAQTTNSTFTAPVLTTTIATNVITVKVTNVALCTVDSQVLVDIVVC